MDTKYEQATFYFYTGTGNSYRVARWMAETAEEAGSAVTVRAIEAARPSAKVGQEDRTLVGLFTPTHGFTTPWAMLKFALKLPRARADAFVIATRAGVRIGSTYCPGYEGTALLLLALILTLKGYRIRGLAGIDMPSNWIALHPGLSPDAVAGIKERARVRTTRFARVVFSGGTSFADPAAYPLGLLLLPLSIAYVFVGRLFLSKLFFASDRCTGCGICARNCPNHAIEMRDGRPYWTFRCESCMRCMAYCPTQAIEASHLLAGIVLLLVGAIPATTFLNWLAARLPALGFLRRTPEIVRGTAVSIGILALVYPLLHVIQGTRWGNRFFTYTTLTHRYRRYHEPETKLRDLG